MAINIRREDKSSTFYVDCTIINHCHSLVTATSFLVRQVDGLEKLHGSIASTNQPARMIFHEIDLDCFQLRRQML